MCLSNHYIKFGGEPTTQNQKGDFYTPALKVKLAAILATLWGFPSIYVAVPFSSVLQVLFIILESKPPYLCRGVLGITISNLEGN